MTEMKQAARDAMVEFISELAGNVPAGTKAAEAQLGLQMHSRLVKLAAAVARSGDIIQAVAETYAHKSAGYRHQLVDGLVRGLHTKLAGLGMTAHPSAGVTGALTPGAMPGQRATVGPQTQTFGPTTSSALGVC